jgi:hypothetical protein
MAELHLKLRKFNVKALYRDPMVFIIGKRRTGKSVLIADLLFHRNSCGVAVSGTEEPVYGKFMQKQYIYDTYTPELIENVIKRQGNIKRQFDKDITETGTSSIDQRTFIVLDDCFQDDKWSKDVGIRFLFMNGRCISTSCIFAMSYAMGMPPNLRGNIDYVFIFRESIMANRERIWRQYAMDIFSEFDTFCQVMDQCTLNFECLVIDKRSSSSKIEDRVFWYKAEIHPDADAVGATTTDAPDGSVGTTTTPSS